MANDSLVGKEEENALPEPRYGDWTADVAADVVVVQNRNCLWHPEPVRRRVQSIVLEVVICHSVIVVGAALGDLVIDDSAQTILGREKPIDHLYFADRVEDGSRDYVVAHHRAGCHSVHQRRGVRQAAVRRYLQSGIRGLVHKPCT